MSTRFILVILSITASYLYRDLLPKDVQSDVGILTAPTVLARIYPAITNVRLCYIVNAVREKHNVPDPPGIIPIERGWYATPSTI